MKRHFFRCVQLLALLFAGAGMSASAATGLTAGAGRAAIDIPAASYPLHGFVGQHDPLYTRVLLLNNGGHEVGLVVIDMTSLTDEVSAKMKQEITSETKIPAKDLIISCAHNFSSFHLFPPRGANDPSAKPTALLISSVLEATKKATIQAKQEMQPVTVGFGRGVTHINVNRNVKTPKGWWLGGDDAGFSDHDLDIIRLDGKNGAPVAVLLNVAVQSSVMDESVSEKYHGRLYSADLAGAATAYLENWYGGNTVAMFLIGAAGDQSPYLQADHYDQHKDGTTTRVDMHDDGFRLLDLLGEHLGSTAARTSDAITGKTSDILRLTRTSFMLPAYKFNPKNRPMGPVTSFTYTPGPDQEFQALYLQIGDVMIVGVYPEMAAELGVAIKKASPYKHTIVVTMMDGGAKYMSPARYYDEFTYEARDAFYARGAGEMAVSKIIKTLNTQHKGAK